MGEVNLIVITLKSVGEGKTVVFSDVPLHSRFSFEIVHLVYDVGSCSKPSNTVARTLICTVT